MFAAVLDTNVLWPSLQRDFLLSLAAEGLYRPLWSNHILAELRICEVEKLCRVGVPDEEAQHRAAGLEARMRHVFDDALVVGYEPHIGTFGLPDRLDEHVLAAAVVGNAGVIVTHNVKHFPPPLLPLTLHVATPAEFAASTVEIDPTRAATAVAALAGRSGVRGPVMSASQALDALSARYGMAEVHAMLGELLSGDELP